MADPLAPETNAPYGLDARILYAPPDRTDVALSPDGGQLAFLGSNGGRVNLWLADVETPERVRPLIRDVGRQVFRFAWSADGKRLIYLTGPRADFGTIGTADDDFVLFSLNPETGESLRLSERLDRRVIFQSGRTAANEIFVSPSPRGPKPRNAWRVNIMTGERSVVMSNDGLAPVYADRSLKPRFATRSGKSMGLDLLRRGADDEWHVVRALDFADRVNFKFFGLNGDGTEAYVAHTGGYDMGALIAIDVATSTETVIARTREGMIAEVLAGADNGEPVAYKTFDLKGRWTALDETYAEDFRTLADFDSGDLSVESQNVSGTRWVVSYEADTKPRHYYLYERDSGRVRPLFSASVARAGLAYQPSTAISTTAPDGLRITGYLTLPGHRTTHPLPLVVWFHGGPWDRMSGGFDPWAQWLASRGYAALNVNFRGSSGFGKSFIEAHYGQWGGAMQSDSLTLIQWAVDKGIADKDRIALAGLSHGGYAVLNLMADEPGRFACGIAISGLSDLNLFLDTLTAHEATLSDADAQAEFAERMVRERRQLGADERTPRGRRFLAARSPITKTSEFADPLLVVHGLKDLGVVPAHSEKLAAALDVQGKPVTRLAFPDEGHVIIKAENWLAFLAVSETFLGQCFKTDAPGVELADIDRSSFQVPVGTHLVNGLQSALEARGAVQ